MYIKWRGYLIKLMDLLEIEADPKNIEESKYKPSDVTQMVREKLKDFQVQRDFPGKDWQGIEMLCYKLAELCKEVSVEAAGWYKYSSSTRFDKDGKDWRYVCKTSRRPVVVNCHSLLHDNIWTLNTTIFDTTQINVDNLKPIGHEDVWKRSMLWTIETAKVLQTDDFNYSEPLNDFSSRMSAVDELYGMKQKLELEIKEVFKKIFHRQDKMPQKISIGINTWQIKPGRVAVYYNPKETGLSHGALTIHPKVLKNKEYLRFVLMHELIHAVFDEPTKTSHHKNFQQLATVLGLPKKYQD